MSCVKILPRGKKFAQLLLSLILTSMAVSGLAQSTWIGGSSFYNAGSAYFNENTGILTIPNLEIFTADGLGDSRIATVTLEQSDPERFTVRNYMEKWLPPSCSESEIIAATTQIDLNTSFEEAAAMFSCAPNISQAGVTDLESGKLAVVSWSVGNGTYRQGNLAVSNYSPFFVTSSSTWVSTTQAIGYLSSPTGTPVIALVFREGVLEVINYVTRTRNSQQLCDSSQMASLVEALDIGSTLGSVNETLGCEGSLISTRIDANGKEEIYNWVGQPPVFSQTPNIQPPDFYTFVSLQGRFSEASATAFEGTITRNRLSGSECTIEGLSAASDHLFAGMSEDRLQQIVGCSYSASNTSFSTDRSSTVHYQWQTSIPNSSQLLSLNRRLSVSVIDGVIDSVTLTRY